MRSLQIPAFAAWSFFLPSLGDAAVTNSSSFAHLLNSLGNLGYHAEAASTFGALDHVITADAADAYGSCARTVRSHRSLDLPSVSIHPLTVLAKVSPSRHHSTQYNEPDRKPLLHPTRSLILVSPTSRDPANLPNTPTVRHRCVSLAPHHQILQLPLRRKKRRPCHVCRRIEYSKRPHHRSSEPQPDTGIPGQDRDACSSRKSLDRRVQSIG